MTTRSWLRNLFASRTPRTIRKAPAGRQPQLERLEDRLVPATIVPPGDLVQFNVASETLNATAGIFRIPIIVGNSEPIDGEIEVPFTMGGSARAGIDYSGVNSSPLVFGVNQGGDFITGTLLPHPGGPNETLTFTLGEPLVGYPPLQPWTYDPQDAALGHTTVNTLTITEPASTTVSIAAPDVTYNGNGTVKVTMSSSAGTPTGTVQLSVDGGAPLSQTLTSGSALFTLPNLNAGDHTLHAVYATQGDYYTSSADGVLHVNPAATSIAVSAPTITSPSDGTIKLTVSAPAGVPTPSGTVTLSVNGGTPLSAPLAADGTATFTLPSPNPGDYTLHAVYAPQGNYSGSSADSTLSVYSLASIQKFVQALYTDELGRTATATEVASWVNVFVGPGGQSAVVAGIANSTEARNRVVTGWYQTYLGRTPSATEINAQAAALATQTQEQVLSGILGSTEFFNDAQNMGFGGTANQNYVEALYEDLLGRTPSSAELASQVAALQQVGPQKLALSILQSTEYRADVVEGYYTTLLHRTGSAAEVASWVNTGLDLHTIRMDIEDSAEFFVNG